MSSGPSIWPSYAATFQPIRFPLYSSTLYLPRNGSCAAFQIATLGASICSPLAETSGPGTLQPPRGTHVLETQSVVVSNTGVHAGLSRTPPQPDFPSSDGEPACFVCAIAASESCYCCDQRFCRRHIYQCAECQTAFCGDCLDLHAAEGHWSDSDTAAALADSSYRGFHGGCSPITSRSPEATTTQTSTTASATNVSSRSTFEKVLHLLSFATLFSIFAALRLEASR